jgi:glycerophosphoryl diester phosphodiesterase
VLELLGSAGVGVHLDLKSQGAERPGRRGAAAAGARGADGRQLVPQCDAARAAHRRAGLRLGRTYPQDRTGLTKRSVFHPPARAIVRVLRRTLPAPIDALLSGSRATAAVLYWEVLSEAAVARCHALGAPVLVWTVDDAELLPWLDEIGVDGVITNDPRIFRG